MARKSLSSSTRQNFTAHDKAASQLALCRISVKPSGQASPSHRPACLGPSVSGHRCPTWLLHSRTCQTCLAAEAAFRLPTGAPNFISCHSLCKDSKARCFGHSSVNTRSWGSFTSRRQGSLQGLIAPLSASPCIPMISLEKKIEHEPE